MADGIDDDGREGDEEEPGEEAVGVEPAKGGAALRGAWGNGGGGVGWCLSFSAGRSRRFCELPAELGSSGGGVGEVGIGFRSWCSRSLGSSIGSGAGFQPVHSLGLGSSDFIDEPVIDLKELLQRGLILKGG